MTLSHYAFGLIRAWGERRIWERTQYFKLFPVQPREVYNAMKAAGFDPERYRLSRPDLKAGLPSDDWSAKHFLQFMTNEVRLPYSFAIKIDFAKLKLISEMKIASSFYKATLIRNIIQAQIDYDSDCIYDSAFWRQAFDVIRKVGRPIVIIGDSHSLIYRQTAKDEDVVIVPLNIFCGGGSAIGLPNPKSFSQYGVRLERAAKAIKASESSGELSVPVCFGFGQVDMEFVFTYRRLKSGQYSESDGEFGVFCTEVAETYVNWIATLGLTDAVVLGINPPCIDNEYINEAYKIQMQLYLGAGIADVKVGDRLENLLPGFDKLNFRDKPSRTLNHKIFNEKIFSYAERLKIKYLDCFDIMLSSQGCIDRKYSCAANGSVLEIGKVAKDIHVGGKFATQAKANLIKKIARAFPVAKHQRRFSGDSRSQGHAEEGLRSN